MTSLPKTFEIYLLTQGTTKVTIKNYLSDLNHFLAWLELKVRSRNLPIMRETPEFVKFYFTQEFLSEYKKFLLANSLPFSTVNRRLSALRTFGKFCLSQAWISENPAKKVTNVTLVQSPKSKVQSEEILGEFRKHLEEEQTAPNTIRNYLSDIKEFFTWVEVLGT